MIVDACNFITAADRQLNCFRNPQDVLRNEAITQQTWENRQRWKIFIPPIVMKANFDGFALLNHCQFNWLVASSKKKKGSNRNGLHVIVNTTKKNKKEENMNRRLIARKEKDEETVKLARETKDII